MSEIQQSKNKIVLFNLLSTIILQGLTFFSAPIFSSLLGTENYGVISVYNTWVVIFSTVCSLQAGSTIVLARSNFKADEQEKYQSSVLSLAISIYLIFFIIIEFVFYGREKILGLNKYLLPFALLQGLGNYCVGILNNKFTYEFKALKNLILSSFLAIVNIGLSILLVLKCNAENNYLGRVIGEVVAYTIFGIFSSIYIFSKGKEFYNKKYWLFTIPIGLPNVFHLLAGLLLGQSDRLMLQGMIGLSATGIYTLASSFSSVIQSLWSAFNNSWAPYYYEYTRLDQIETMKKHAKNYIELFSVIAGGFVLLSVEVYHLFADKRYWEGTGFIPVFVLSFYFMFLYSFPVNFEFYNKRTKLIAIATTIAAITNVVLNYFFINKFGIIGAVVATTIAHCIQFLIHHIFTIKLIKVKYPFRITEFIPGFVFVVFCCTCCYFPDEFWYLRWIFAISLGCFELYKVINRRSIF